MVCRKRLFIRMVLLVDGIEVACTPKLSMMNNVME